MFKRIFVDNYLHSKNLRHMAFPILTSCISSLMFHCNKNELIFHFFWKFSLPTSRKIFFVTHKFSSFLIFKTFCLCKKFFLFSAVGSSGKNPFEYIYTVAHFTVIRKKMVIKLTVSTKSPFMLSVCGKRQITFQQKKKLFFVCKIFL